MFKVYAQQGNDILYTITAMQCHDRPTALNGQNHVIGRCCFYPLLQYVFFFLFQTQLDSHDGKASKKKAQLGEAVAQAAAKETEFLRTTKKKVKNKTYHTTTNEIQT